MARFFGVMLVGIGLICCFTSNATASVLRRKVIMSLYAADTVGLFLALIAQLKPAFNSLGWILVAVWFLLTFFLGYFAFVKPED